MNVPVPVLESITKAIGVFSKLPVEMVPVQDCARIDVSSLSQASEAVKLEGDTHVFGLTGAELGWRAARAAGAVTRRWEGFILKRWEMGKR